MYLKFAHLCIVAKDLQETMDFYINKLGMEKAYDFKKEGKLFGFYLKIADRQFIEVFGGQPESASSAIKHLCLETDDINGLRQHWSAKGVDVTEVKLGCDNSYQFWIKDPNGVDIEIHEYTKNSSQLTGKDAEVI